MYNKNTGWSDFPMNLVITLLLSGVVEGERGGTPFPKYFVGGMAFPQLLSEQGGMVIQ